MPVLNNVGCDFPVVSPAVFQPRSSWNERDASLVDKVDQAFRSLQAALNQTHPVASRWNRYARLPLIGAAFGVGRMAWGATTCVSYAATTLLAALTLGYLLDVRTHARGSWNGLLHLGRGLVESIALICIVLTLADWATSDRKRGAQYANELLNMVKAILTQIDLVRILGEYDRMRGASWVQQVQTAHHNLQQSSNALEKQNEALKVDGIEVQASSWNRFSSVSSVAGEQLEIDQRSWRTQVQRAYHNWQLAVATSKSLAEQAAQQQSRRVNWVAPLQGGVELPAYPVLQDVYSAPPPAYDAPPAYSDVVTIINRSIMLSVPLPGSPAHEQWMLDCTTLQVIASSLNIAYSSQVVNPTQRQIQLSGPNEAFQELQARLQEGSTGMSSSFCGQVRRGLVA